MKILVTEDEPKIASFIKKGLEEAGHIVDHALTGNSCLTKKIQFQSPDPL